MSKMRDERQDPLELIQQYREAGEPVPPDKQMNSILGTIRLTLLDVLYNGVEGISLATALLYNTLTPEEWVENGLWQDLLDHISMNYHALALVHLLEGRMTTDQVWIRSNEEPDDISLGIGFAIWGEDQLSVLPVGSVVRWKEEDGFKVAVKVSPTSWQSPGHTRHIDPEFPAVILAGPGVEDEFEAYAKVHEARKGAERDNE